MRQKIMPMTLISLAAALTSCGLIAPKNSLERVAKDWSMTVRASQVMPIYPLEEDIRPGDIYISNNSINTEMETWEKKGFLPLVNRYARIPISQEQYNYFFSNSFTQVDPPSFYRPSKAAFPSYNFSVDNRGSLGLAIPLNSVPVALAASGAQGATGSVVLKDATSQGLPDQIMNEILWTWANRQKTSLAYMASISSEPTILRVITRTFSIQGATVSLTFDETSGTTLQAGAPVSSPELLSSSEENYKSLITYLNTQLELKKADTALGDTPAVPPVPEEASSNPEIAALQADIARVNNLRTQQQLNSLRGQITNLESQRKYDGYVLPGGSFRVAARSERGITMDETFDKPLVLGYWATEYLILPSGGIMPIGKVEDLIENPRRYEDIRKLSVELAARQPRSTTVDTGNGNPLTR
ncbi:hypothetical protein ACU5P1_14550 [Pseudomonas plecoglossicida]|uniref:hypothetical protein n=1 Tax=Pseudomonas plecoglossicida TaxID=70775 RepID=UPI0003A8D49A|nr:hypothetical protein [Pseudomonas plecoglossicida]QLB55928.1 hypothetical protein HAV28_14390 [Pseudomonas plecoglossicida]